MRSALITAVLLGCCAGRVLAQSVTGQSDVAVVVNQSNAVSNLTLTDLRKLFNGERHSWPGSVPVRPIVRAPGCSERTTLLKLLKMTESEYKQYWAAQVFRGEADAEPFAAPSVGMTMEAVRTFPGGIALVDSREVKAGLKIVKVEGLLPGAAGYPLH